MASETDKVAGGITGKGEDTPRGFAFGLAAYLLWGVMPLFFKATAHLPVTEVLAHRVVWAVPIAGIVLAVLGRPGSVARAFSDRRMLAMACLTAVLVSINWSLYVFAVVSGHTLEAALGYFINPLFSIFLAAVVLKERLSVAQLAAIGLVALAVAILTIEAGRLPWIALGLTVSWGLYALFRKTLPIGANEGFFLEVLLISVVCLPYILFLEATGQGHFLHSGAGDKGLLVACGLATAGPLMIYANGAKLLRLSTIAMLQYVAPTIAFLIAVFSFGEPLSPVRLAAFALIWIAIAIYTWSLLARSGRRQGMDM